MTEGNDLKKQRHMDTGSKRPKKMERSREQICQAEGDESRRGSRSHAEKSNKTPAVMTAHSTDATGWREQKPAKEDYAVEEDAVGDRISTNTNEKNKRRIRWTRCIMSWIRRSKRNRSRTSIAALLPSRRVS